MKELTKEELQLELTKKNRMCEQLATRLAQRELEIAELQTQAETYIRAFEEVKKELKEAHKGGGAETK
ncbi:hypothetical protein [Shouchella lonarensis]|uniref:Uncharacterized protein n=1 Tax=Shouchella lonarensis TaxID=1464122 RepID=A0A1G6HPI2_9BACI|nr:hypothetical protein [Shouchella lonarensis]SDB96207.1 hypothetical protein SAMN05421737_104114 [Shouchella lonarensis]